MRNEIIDYGKITSMDRQYDDDGILTGENLIIDDNDTIFVDMEFMNKHSPVVGKYIALYRNGYKAIYPADTFEN